ncbi:MAG TPA: ferric reductase-like transmembrane domain-containing protein [Acidimicrobiia bacterium]|nr:ferric reductase-like transmembrane domain-containing protein [Acidimicrobiia bacterium]
MSQLPWFVARASGLVGWALVSASVVWGLTLSGKPFGRRPHPAWLLDLHRYLGGLATIFTLVHVAAVIADSYVHFTLTSALVPFVATWKPVAIAWGIVGLYLLVAIELTSLAGRRLPKRVWRAVHFASFPLFVVATIHGLTAGEDTTSTLALLVVLSVAVVVVVLTIVRVRATRTSAPRDAFRTTSDVTRSGVAPPRPVAARSARRG